VHLSPTSDGVLRAARNTRIRLLAEVIGRIAALLLFAVMARELGPRGFGDFAFAVSVAFLLTTLAEPGIDSIVVRDVARRPGDAATVLQHALAVKLVAGPLAVAVAALIAFLGHYQSDLRIALVLLALSGALDLLASTVYATFQGLADLAPEALARTLQASLRAGAGIAVLVAGGGLVELSAVYLGAAIVALAYASWILPSKAGVRRLNASIAGARAMAATALPIALAGVFDVAGPALAIVLLSALEGNEAVGLFGAASRLVESTWFIGAALAAAVSPMLARAGKRDEPSLAAICEGAAKALLIALVPLGAGLALFAEPLMRLIFGFPFVPGAAVLQILGGTVLLHGISQLAFEALVARGRQHLTARIAALTAALQLVLIVTLVPDLSIEGAAIGVLAATLAYTLAAGAAVVRLSGSLSTRRMALAPVLGALTMGGLGALAHPGIPALLAALIAYAATVLVVEWRLHPEDLRWTATALTGRSRTA
jgi:O-antigen/teichoic acid export membrane protein